MLLKVVLVCTVTSLVEVCTSVKEGIWSERAL